MQDRPTTPGPNAVQSPTTDPAAADSVLAQRLAMLEQTQHVLAMQEANTLALLAKVPNDDRIPERVFTALSLVLGFLLEEDIANRVSHR